MKFNSWWDRFCWKIKTKRISKKFARGHKITDDEWNHLAKPFLREAMESIRKNCPYEKTIREGK